MKKIYVIRHCKAEGQASESPLTEEGFSQAEALSTFFEDVKIERIISSPYKRAIQTVEPLSKRLNLEIELNDELKERVLSNESLSDWLEKLRKTFDHPNLKFAGGESSKEAVKRIAGVVDSIFKSDLDNTIIVTHGNLMALLLNYYNQQFGFEEWVTLGNPDIYLLKSDRNGITYERIKSE